MIYQWSGTSRYQVDPQMVGETVEKLAERNGGVCPPSAFVNEARADDSPLHPVVFRLPPAEAAEAWYQHEARRVINSLRVVQTPGEQSDIPAFLHIRIIEEEGVREGYAPASAVVRQVDWHQQAIQEALAALKGWRRRYDHVEELRPIIAAIEAAEERV